MSDQKPQTQEEAKAAQAAAFKIRKIPEFSSTSRNGQRCSISGGGQKKDGPGVQPHEVDEFILRGPAIQSEGFFDIRPSVLRAIALEFTDLVPPVDEDLVTELTASNESLRERTFELEQHLAEADRVIARLSAAAPDEEPDAGPEDVFFDDPEDVQDEDEG